MGQFEPKSTAAQPEEKGDPYRLPPEVVAQLRTALDSQVLPAQSNK